MMVARLAVCLVIVFACSLSAQEYSFRYFGTAEGLNNLAVLKIFQDTTGFIWVSTENGVYRYDGERFEFFGPAQGIPVNSGSAFGDAPDGSLLAGGDFGLYRLKGNRFEKVQGPFNKINWAQGIQADGEGRTYLGTDAGLIALDSPLSNGRFSTITFPNPEGASGAEAYGIAVDGLGVWYGCGQRLCRMAGGATHVVDKESGLPDGAVLAIKEDRDKNLWVRVRNEGVYELPMGQTVFRRPTGKNLPSGLTANPSIDSDERILLPSPDGLFIDTRKGWHKIDRSSGLRGTVYSAYEDRQRSLWIGTAGRGVAEWVGYREWSTYSTNDGLTSDVAYEILPLPDGSLWVATEAGLFRGEVKPFGLTFKKFDAAFGSAVHSIQAGANGDLWIGTEVRGVGHIGAKGGAVRWFGEREGLTGKAAYTIRFDSEHRLWAATEAGLFVASAPYERFTRVTELPVARYWAVLQGTDGTMWAGGASGLSELTGGRWKTFTRLNGLSNQEVLSLGAGPNGTVWAGYRFGGGIDRVHPTANGIKVEKGIQRPGTSGLIYFLDFDKTGHLWAGTERGVDMWDGTRWSHYDTSDGLAWDDCNLNAFAQGPDGAFWIGTSGGLSRFLPRPRLTSTAPLKVVFTRIMAAKTDVSELNNPAFDSHEVSIDVRYSALNATRQNEVQFRYRLEGSHTGWIETSERELQFANLAPGKYRLQIEAKGADNGWSGQAAVFAFRILTPWYMSWWFFSLCALAPLSIVLVVLRLRILGAHKRERELVRMVEEKTADLQHANEELSRLSFTDPLTGLSNRRVFDMTLEKECARITRIGDALSLVILDVDQFKALNDSEGHQRGDEYLMLVAGEMNRIARRRIDVAARFGGEEFALILPSTDAESAFQIAESVRLAISDLELPHPASVAGPFLTISAGVATARPESGISPEMLISAADRALYRAKRSGRNRVVAAPEALTQEREDSSIAGHA